MSNATQFEPDDLLMRAKRGDRAAVATLISQYRDYLALLARLQVGQLLQGKVDRSDLVQETCLQVHRTFDQFRGETEADFMHWLRRIMACVAANTVRKFSSGKRDLHLERRLGESLDGSSHHLGQLLLSRESTPSHNTMRRERSKILADALAKLPDHYREVIILHHLDGLRMSDVARRMGRSTDSVQKYWARAIARLRHLLGDQA